MTRLSFLFVASTGLLAAVGASAADPRGHYLTASGNLEVEVAPCGSAWCGTVTQVIANHSMSRPGETMQAADTRPALGMTLLSGFVPDGDDAAKAWRGQIYNRENGKTYDCLMSIDDAGNLQLHAYVLFPLFGKTQVWPRQPDAAVQRQAVTGAVQ